MGCYHVVSFVVTLSILNLFVFFFKQKTAYELRIRSWSSDVCSSDLFSLHDASWPWKIFGGPFPPSPTRVMQREAGFDKMADREIGRASCRERVCQYV